MRSDLQISGKKRILRTYALGKRAKIGYRKRVTFRGSIIGPDVAQLNLKFVQYGTNPLEAENQEGSKKE